MLVQRLARILVPALIVGLAGSAAAGPEDCGPFGVPVRLLPLGDSITQGTPSSMSYRRPLWHDLEAVGPIFEFIGSLDSHAGGPPVLPDFDVDHEGHAGWTTAHILNGRDGMGSLSDWLQAYDPDVVLLHIGTNDLKATGNDLTVVATTLGGVDQIIDVLRADVPDVCILIAQLIPTDRAPIAARIPLLNALIPPLAAQKTTQLSPVIVVDQFTGFDAVTDTYDGLHPNGPGERKMADRWLGVVTSIPIVPQCSDGMDNDGDGFTDHPADPGCAAPDQFREDTVCQDGIDNDGDGLVDFGFDPGCQYAYSETEWTKCNDGEDNDGDGLIDFDGGLAAGLPPGSAPDPQCTSAGAPAGWRNNEAPPPTGPSCGLGPELLPVLALLGLSGRRRRQRRRAIRP
jgi:lysophospholipase L1-like esterase